VTTAVFDPADISALRDSLSHYMSQRFGDVTVVEGPTRFPSGLDTFVYAVRIAGDLPPDWAMPLVLRIFPSMDQQSKAEREFDVQRFVTDKGFPAPLPLHIDVSGDPWGLPFMIMERVEGASAISLFKNPLRISETVTRMSSLHARLHMLPTEGCPLPYNSALVDRFLEPSRELLRRYRLPDLDGPLGWLDRNAGRVRDEEPVLTHNDFHPLNLIVDGDQITVIDWPGAALGDRHCDVARTLGLFALAPELERSLLGRTALKVFRGFIIRRYEAAYTAALPLDDNRLRYWEALHAFNGWVQIATMRQEGEAAVGARAGVLAEIPVDLMDGLKRYFEERAV
jgi:aminoglycoside phosphotransferase (APT) family kinase protein